MTEWEQCKSASEACFGQRNASPLRALAARKTIAELTTDVWPLTEETTEEEEQREGKTREIDMQ